MKKILSFVLAISIIALMMVPAFAADKPSVRGAGINVVVEELANDVVTATFYVKGIVNTSNVKAALRFNQAQLVPYITSSETLMATNKNFVSSMGNGAWTKTDADGYYKFLNDTMKPNGTAYDITVTVSRVGTGVATNYISATFNSPGTTPVKISFSSTANGGLGEKLVAFDFKKVAPTTTLDLSAASISAGATFEYSTSTVAPMNFNELEGDALSSAIVYAPVAGVSGVIVDAAAFKISKLSTPSADITDVSSTGAFTTWSTTADSPTPVARDGGAVDVTVSGTVTGFAAGNEYGVRMNDVYLPVYATSTGSGESLKGVAFAQGGKYAVILKNLDKMNTVGKVKINTYLRNGATIIKEGTPRYFSLPAMP